MRPSPAGEYLLGGVGGLTNRPSPDGELLSSLGAADTLGIEGSSLDQVPDRAFPTSRSESTVRAGVCQACSDRMVPSRVEGSFIAIVLCVSAIRVFRLTFTFDRAQLDRDGEGFRALAFAQPMLSRLRRPSPWKGEGALMRTASRPRLG